MLFISTFFLFSGPDGTQRLKLLFFYHTAIYSLAVLMFVESLSCPKVKLSWSKWGGQSISTVQQCKWECTETFLLLSIAPGFYSIGWEM